MFQVDGGHRRLEVDHLDAERVGLVQHDAVDVPREDGPLRVAADRRPGLAARQGEIAAPACVQAGQHHPVPGAHRQPREVRWCDAPSRNLV